MAECRSGFCREGIMTDGPPFPFPPMELVMVWHRRSEKDTRMMEIRKILKNGAGHTDEQLAALSHQQHLLFDAYTT
jgi:hypothetical protein